MKTTTLRQIIHLWMPRQLPMPQSSENMLPFQASLQKPSHSWKRTDPSATPSALIWWRYGTSNLKCLDRCPRGFMPLQPGRRRIAASCSVSCLPITLAVITWIILPTRWKPALRAWPIAARRRTGIGPGIPMPISSNKPLPRTWWSMATVALKSAPRSVICWLESRTMRSSPWSAKCWPWGTTTRPSQRVWHCLPTLSTTLSRTLPTCAPLLSLAALDEAAAGAVTPEEEVVVGAALENSLWKKKFKIIFFQVQCCRYGVSDELSSRECFKKIVLSRPKRVFSCVCVFLLAKLGFWLVFLLVYLSVCLLLIF